MSRPDFSPYFIPPHRATPSRTECEVTGEHHGDQHQETDDNGEAVLRWSCCGETEPDPDPPCRECGAPTDDGEGFDGYCGNCADRAEQRGEWGP